MAAPGLEFLDQEVVKPPPSFEGEKTKWRHFNAKLLNFVGGLSPPLREVMEVVPGLKTPVDHTALAMSADQINLDGKLSTILSSLLEGNAMGTFCSVEEGLDWSVTGCWRETAILE